MHVKCVAHVDRILELVIALFLLLIRTEILAVERKPPLCNATPNNLAHLCRRSGGTRPPSYDMMGAADSSKNSVKSTRLHGVTSPNSAATHRAAFPTLTRLLQSRPCSVHNINIANHKQMDKTCQRQRLTDARVSYYLVT